MYYLKTKRKNTSLSHIVALANIFFHYHEHRHCSFDWYDILDPDALQQKCSKSGIRLCSNQLLPCLKKNAASFKSTGSAWLLWGPHHRVIWQKKHCHTSMLYAYIPQSTTLPSWLITWSTWLKKLFPIHNHWKRISYKRIITFFQKSCEMTVFYYIHFISSLSFGKLSKGAITLLFYCRGPTGWQLTWP